MTRCLLLGTAAGLAMSAGVAVAAPVDFMVSGALSDVTLTYGGGCFSGSTCIGASLASGLDGTAFTLTDEGDSATFDFLTFSTSGFGAFVDYDISATLGFSTPLDASTTSSGSVFALGVGFGGYLGGILSWADVPLEVTLSSGDVIGIDFESGFDLKGKTITTSATVTLLDAAVVPLPAGGLLLLAGLGGLAMAKRRKKA